MPLILPNTIVNGENADAVPVEQNYSLIESYVNNEVIQRNGLVAMKRRCCSPVTRRQRTMPPTRTTSTPNLRPVTPPGSPRPATR